MPYASNLGKKKKRNMIWTISSAILILLALSGITMRVTLPGMWKYLVIDEKPVVSDIIIVLSGDSGRVEHGVDLYKQGLAQKMLFAGGGARAMQRQAIKLGVAEDHTLLDRRSHSTYENAVNSARILKENNLHSAIIVTSDYHTRRASLIFSQFMPRKELVVSSASTGATPNTWWKNENLWAAVSFEYLKLVWFYIFERKAVAF